MERTSLRSRPLSSSLCRIPAAVDIGRLYDYHPSNLLFLSHPLCLSFCRKFLLRSVPHFPSLSLHLAPYRHALALSRFFFPFFFPVTDLSLPLSLSLFLSSLFPFLCNIRLSAFLSSLSRILCSPSLFLQLHTSSLNNTHQRELPATTTTHWRHRQYGTPLYWSSFPAFTGFNPNFPPLYASVTRPARLRAPAPGFIPSSDKSNRPPGYPRRSLTAVRVRYRRSLGTSRHFDSILRDNSIPTSAAANRSLFDRSQFKMFRYISLSLSLSVKQNFEPIANARRLSSGVQIQITFDSIY